MGREVVMVMGGRGTCVKGGGDGNGGNGGGGRTCWEGGGDGNGSAAEGAEIGGGREGWGLSYGNGVWAEVRIEVVMVMAM